MDTSGNDYRNDGENSRLNAVLPFIKLQNHSLDINVKRFFPLRTSSKKENRH